MNETSFKGYASEKLVEFDLLMQGIDCIYPSRPDASFDLVAVVDGEFYTIQVKTGWEKDNTIRADIRKSPDRKGKKNLYYDGEIDVFAITDLPRRKVAYFINKDAHRQITFRLCERKCSCRYEPRFFDDYTKFPVEELMKLRNKKAPAV
jgi:hypothetical protein